MLCSWIVVVTSAAVVYCFVWYTNNVRQGVIVLHVGFTLRTVFLLSTAAVNIYMFKKLRKKDGLAHNQLSTAMVPQANAQQKSIHLKRKASKLVLSSAIIMIVTCLPHSLGTTIISACYVYKLHFNSIANSTIVAVSSIMQNLNFLVNPLVYIWKDRIYRNAFYRTFKIKTAQF